MGHWLTTLLAGLLGALGTAGIMHLSIVENLVPCEELASIIETTAPYVRDKKYLIEAIKHQGELREQLNKLASELVRTVAILETIDRRVSRLEQHQ